MEQVKFLLWRVGQVKFLLWRVGQVKFLLWRVEQVKFLLWRVGQVNFLAHPGTSGAQFVDHIVADRVVQGGGATSRPNVLEVT